MFAKRDYQVDLASQGAISKKRIVDLVAMNKKSILIYDHHLFLKQALTIETLIEATAISRKGSPLGGSHLRKDSMSEDKNLG